MSGESSKHQKWNYSVIQKSHIPGHVFKRNEITVQRLSVPLFVPGDIVCSSCGTNPSVCGHQLDRLETHLGDKPGSVWKGLRR